MDTLPLHPALVHLPVALAFILPPLAILISVMLLRGVWPRSVWGVVLGLQILTFGGALLAERTGEQDEEKVEEVVPENAIHQHEELAERFTTFAGVMAGLTLLGLLLPERFARYTWVPASTLLFVGTWFAYEVGHAGGTLVYRYNAGSVSSAAAGALPPTGAADAPGGEGEEDD